MRKRVEERRQRRMRRLRRQRLERQVVDLEAAAEVADAMAIRFVGVRHEHDAMTEAKQQLAELVDVRLDPADPGASGCSRGTRSHLGNR